MIADMKGTGGDFSCFGWLSLKSTASDVAFNFIDLYTQRMQKTGAVTQPSADEGPRGPFPTDNGRRDPRAKTSLLGTSPVAEGKRAHMCHVSSTSGSGKDVDRGDLDPRGSISALPNPAPLHSGRPLLTSPLGRQLPSAHLAALPG